MAKVKVPLQGKVYQSIDEIELVGGISPYLIDGRSNDAGHTERRGGLLKWVDLDTSARIDGLYWDNIFKALFAVSNGRIFKITDNAGTFSEITGDALASNTLVAFTNNGTHLVMANGGRMITYNNSGTTAYIADTDAPTEVSHLGYLDGYVIANVMNTTRIQWSAIADALTWNAIDFVGETSVPDMVNSFSVGFREILVGTAGGMEPFYNDEVTGITRLPGAFVQRGIKAPYSMKFIDNTWFFVDHELRVVRLENRIPKSISAGMDRTFQTYKSGPSIIGNHCIANGLNYYVLTFPTDSVTWAYDYKADDWAQWAYWDTDISEYANFMGRVSCFVPDWGLHLWGGYVDGKIYIMDRSYYDDDGNPIRTARRSGYINHSTMNRKISNSLTVKYKRGVGQPGGIEPQMMLRWRDDGSTTWSTERDMSMGKSGDTNFIFREQSLGMYRDRQYEFSVSDPVPFVLVEAEEDADLLEF